MSTSAAAPGRTLEHARGLPRVHAAWLAAGLVAAFAVRLVLVWQRATPNYFPDEYLYAALGRSLGALGTPSVRSEPAHFPALLQPLVTAAAWRAGGVDTGYRIVQSLNALAVTLAAIPAWLLARRLGLGRGVALAAAALTLAVPDTLYAGFVVAEPFAYPLALAATVAGVGALARPSGRTQLAFLTLAAPAAFARIQFVVLPLCFLLAAGVVALRERAPRRVAREQALVLGLLGLGAAGVLAVGAHRVVGYYGSVLHPHAHPGAVAASAGVNLTVLAYAAGWILVPGALLGVGLALARPRSRDELAFGAFAVMLGAALVAEAALFGDSAMVQERYLFYLAPLGVVAFGLYASRGWPYRRAHAVLAVGLLVLSARVPLSRWAQPGQDDHSPLLLGVQQVERLLGGNAAGAGLVAGLAGALALGAIAASLRPRHGTAAVLVLAVALSGAALATAWTFDTANSRAVLHRYLPVEPSWIDAAHAGPVTLLTAPGGRTTAAEEQLFWNRSVDRVAVLPLADPPDRLASERVTVTGDGLLLAGGKPLRGALAVDGYSSTVVLSDARTLAVSPGFRLVATRGPARVAALMAGRSESGLLANEGTITLWPDRRSPGLAGWLELSVRATDAAPLTLGLGHGVVRARTGHWTRVRVPVCSRGSWSIGFRASLGQLVDGRPVSGRSTVPRFVADPAICAAGARA
ncbi:MAG TPA: hypothetical protein VH416_02245 [Gaiellaceae bacterium]